MSDLHIFTAFFCEYLCELVYVSEGISPGAKQEPAGATLSILLPVVPFYVQLPNVLIISKSLEDGKPGVVHPGLSPLSSLQHILLNQLGCHVRCLWSLSYRSDKLLNINLA